MGTCLFRMLQLTSKGLSTSYDLLWKCRGSSLWSVWWNYDGISGPMMWGSMTSDWYMCNKGKNQSPIDIDPNMLLFDPTLKHIELHGDTITGTVINNGVDLVEVNDSSEFPMVNLTLGPLSYQYTISRIKFHFGSWDGFGSEHSVKGEFFDGEIHIEAYNSDIFSNFSQAQKAPRGIAIIAAFLQVGKRYDDDFEVLVNLSKLVPYKGQRVRLKQFSLQSFLTNIDNYITYEGSFTQPGCYEKVTWIILNRPIAVSFDQMNILRNLRQRDVNHPQSFMADNVRPIMPLNRRTLRTNINFKRGCTMEEGRFYELNTKKRVQE